MFHGDGAYFVDMRRGICATTTNSISWGDFVGHFYGVAKNLQNHKRLLVSLPHKVLATFT